MSNFMNDSLPWLSWMNRWMNDTTVSRSDELNRCKKRSSAARVTLSLSEFIVMRLITPTVCQRVRSLDVSVRHSVRCVSVKNEPNLVSCSFVNQCSWYFAYAISTLWEVVCLCIHFYLLLTFASEMQGKDAVYTSLCKQCLLSARKTGIWLQVCTTDGSIWPWYHQGHQGHRREYMDSIWQSFQTRVGRKRLAQHEIKHCRRCLHEITVILFEFYFMLCEPLIVSTVRCWATTLCNRLFSEPPTVFGGKHVAVSLVANRVLIKQHNMNRHIKHGHNFRKCSDALQQKWTTFIHISRSLKTDHQSCRWNYVEWWEMSMASHSQCWRGATAVVNDLTSKVLLKWTIGNRLANYLKWL